MSISIIKEQEDSTRNSIYRRLRQMPVPWILQQLFIITGGSGESLQHQIGKLTTWPYALSEDLSSFKIVPDYAPALS